jgi:predicted amidohydrolase YtcJ
MGAERRWCVNLPAIGDGTMQVALRAFRAKRREAARNKSILASFSSEKEESSVLSTSGAQ